MINHEDGKLATLKSGTTIVGLKTNDFVIVASDKQSTLGNMAHDLDTQKVYPITSNIALALAGSVGDAAQMIRILKLQSSLYENERNKKMNTKALVTLCANILNANRYYPYMAGFIFGGYVNKPELFGMDAIGGLNEFTKYTTDGSGCEFALGVLDNKYKDNMSKNDAINLIVEAIRTSKKRDVYTGGEKIDIYFIDKKGIEFIQKD